LLIGAHRSLWVSSRSLWGLLQCFEQILEIGVRVKNPIYPRLLSLRCGPGFRFAMRNARAASICCWKYPAPNTRFVRVACRTALSNSGSICIRNNSRYRACRSAGFIFFSPPALRRPHRHLCSSTSRPVPGPWAVVPRVSITVIIQASAGTGVLNCVQNADFHGAKLCNIAG
jgi:hypothetical protein